MSTTEVQRSLQDFTSRSQGVTTHLIGGNEKHDLRATILYHKPGQDGATATISQYHMLEPEHLDARTVTIHDARGSEADYTLENNGFQYTKFDAPLGIDFSDDDQIKKEYYPVMEEHLKNIAGASKVIIFNHIVRSDPWSTDGSAKYKGPAARPHVDQTPEYAPKTLKRIVPSLKSEEEYESIASRHWQWVNTWRPLATVKRDPLIVADYASVAEADLAACGYDSDRITEGEKGIETYWVGSGLKEGQSDDESKHKWYYMHEQKPDEMLLFKIFDSDENAKAKGIAHSSVVVEGTEDLPPRQSIEIRAFVCF